MKPLFPGKVSPILGDIYIFLFSFYESPLSPTVSLPI
jgi:hypothetical protein